MDVRVASRLTAVSSDNLGNKSQRAPKDYYLLRGARPTDVCWHGKFQRQVLSQVLN